MSRLLVVGDPVVALAGSHSDIVTDGALIIEGRQVEALGRREDLEKRGPFDRVVGSPQHLVMPGFINGHFHSMGAGSPGLFQYVFERMNTRIFRRALTDEDSRTIILVALMRAIRGGQTGAVDFNYGNPSLADFGNPPILDAYRTIGMRVALGMVTRDQNIYVHAPDEVFLASLPERSRPPGTGIDHGIRLAHRRCGGGVPAGPRRVGRLRRAATGDPRPGLDARLLGRALPA